MAMVKDPVCKVDVDEKSAWYSSYQDKTYYFSSPECKADFDRDPGRYAMGVKGIVREAGEKIREKRGEAVSRARTRIRSIISTRKDRTAERIGIVSDAFRTVSQRLRDQNQEPIARYTDRAAANVDRFSGYLQQNDADQLIYEAENFVRRRPVLMLGSAFAAGFFIARFLKSSKTVST